MADMKLRVGYIEHPSTPPKAMDSDLFLQRCGSLLLGLPADKAITRILASLGRANRANRAWMIRYNAEFTHFWNTHEWTRGETNKHVTELQGIPVEMGAWLHETLLENEHLHIADTRKMPRRARALQAEFLRQGIGSLLSVPVFYRGRMMLQIGYDTAAIGINWSDGEIALLRKVGRLFALRLLANPSGPAFQLQDAPVSAASIYLRDYGSHQKVPLDEINYITAQGDYSRMYFHEEREQSDARSLRYWESVLAPESFIRISRSVIVNLTCVERLDRRGGQWKLELRGVTEPLSVGRKYRANLFHRL